MQDSLIFNYTKCDGDVPGAWSIMLVVPKIQNTVYTIIREFLVF